MLPSAVTVALPTPSPEGEVIRAPSTQLLVAPFRKDPYSTPWYEFGPESIIVGDGRGKIP